MAIEILMTNSGHARQAERESRRLRNAKARDRLERMREERALQHWLIEVWDRPATNRHD